MLLSFVVQGPEDGGQRPPILVHVPVRLDVFVGRYRGLHSDEGDSRDQTEDIIVHMTFAAKARNAFTKKEQTRTKEMGDAKDSDDRC